MATKNTTAAKAETKVTKPAAKAAKAETKKVETKATATEVKTEVKAETKAETKKAETKKAETKPAAKKTETKTAAKKTTTKTTKKAETKVFVQFYGKEIDVEVATEAAKADYIAKSGKKTTKDVKVYVKPEDNAAYYVIDGVEGVVSL